MLILDCVKGFNRKSAKELCYFDLKPTRQNFGLYYTQKQEKKIGIQFFCKMLLIILYLALKITTLT